MIKFWNLETGPLYVLHDVTNKSQDFFYNCRCPETVGFTYCDKHECIKLQKQTSSGKHMVRHIIPLHDKYQLKSTSIRDIVTNFADTLGSSKV